jgi:hypothetical protein
MQSLRSPPWRIPRRTHPPPSLTVSRTPWGSLTACNRVRWSLWVAAASRGLVPAGHPAPWPLLHPLVPASLPVTRTPLLLCPPLVPWPPLVFCPPLHPVWWAWARCRCGCMGRIMMVLGAVPTHRRPPYPRVVTRAPPSPPPPVVQRLRIRAPEACGWCQDVCRAVCVWSLAVFFFVFLFGCVYSRARCDCVASVRTLGLFEGFQSCVHVAPCLFCKCAK